MNPGSGPSKGIHFPRSIRRKLCPSNRGPASAAEPRPCRANAAVSSEGDGSKQSCNAAVIGDRCKAPRTLISFNPLCAAADKKMWAGALHFLQEL